MIKGKFLDFLARLKISVCLAIFLGGFGLPFSESMANQTCKTEAEIPSSAASIRYVDNGDGTVTDISTDLMWAKCSLGQNVSSCSGDASSFTWSNAMQAANSSELAGHDDWRLPNIKELLSLVEQRCYDPSINLNTFPNTPPSNFWSSSPDISNRYYAWYVGFSDGYTSNDDRGDFHVRLVRSK